MAPFIQYTDANWNLGLTDGFTFFYMPHGEKEMHASILKYNDIRKISILGNSIFEYAFKNQIQDIDEPIFKVNILI